MHRSFQFVAVLSLALLALACASAPTSNEAPTTAWDQQAVTGLAGQLAVAAEAAYTAVRASPELEAPGSENADFGMADTLRTMHEQSVGLRDKLAKGAGMAETLNEYRNLKELSRDLGEGMGYTDLATEEAAPLAGVTSILTQLDAYYGAR
ncbi:MAG: hypothetical protein ACQGVK_24515 [Myxococcota bacterium]